MRDDAERIPLMDAATLQRFQKEIMQAATKFDLDQLTRRLWRAYDDDPKNKTALDQLRTAIKARRDVLARNSQR
jgi:hypothetical protein